MIKLLGIVILIGFAAGSVLPMGRPGVRIIGGNKTDVEKFPWQVSLSVLGDLHNCGGSILNEDTIITAGHCIDGVLSKLYVVLAGATELSAPALKIKIKSAVVHEQFDGMDYDVAIIKLAENLTFSDKVQPVKLPDEDAVIEDGSEVSISGYGVIHTWGILTPNHLYSVNVNIINQETCNKKYHDEYVSVDVTDRMICAGIEDLGGKDACQGDSGGPLTLDGVLVGIVSWGYGCALKEYPGVYTRVTSVRSWIKDQTGL